MLLKVPKKGQVHTAKYLVMNGKFLHLPVDGIPSNTGTHKEEVLDFEIL